MLSIVIPVFNEEASLERLYREIVSVTEENEFKAEIIFVDDGSTDSSWSKVEKLAEAAHVVHGLKFRRNFGKSAALNEGFMVATGQFVVTLDADLQDDPEEIPRLLKKLESGFDLVSGWKRKRNDPWHKVIPSRVFNWLVGAFTGLKLHDHNCGIKAYRAEVVREIRLYGELHRFIPVLAHARGFRVAELEVNHRQRLHGISKYGFSRFAHGLLDLLTVRFMTVYGERPLHVLGWIGSLCFAFGLIGLSYLAVIWLMGQAIGARPILVYSVASLLFGAQMLTFGILAELITWRLANQNGQASTNVVKRTRNISLKPEIKT